MDATIGHEMLSFMDNYSGHNQVIMAPEDKEKIPFITNEGTYYYKAMLFGLRNTRATHQSAMNAMFQNHIGKTI